MSNINAIPVYDPSSRPSVSNTGTSTEELSQNFLRMLTVQLQNQDPMNPMDNAAMTSQLAALNTVDGINRLNDTMSSLMTQMQSANFMNLSGSTGKSLLAQGDAIYFSGEPVYLSAKLESPATMLKAVIKDNAGQIVNQMELGSVAAGVTDLMWDGKNDAGESVAVGDYRVEFTATAADGSDSIPTSYVSAIVAAVGQTEGDITLSLGDGRQISPADILKWTVV